MIPRSRAHRRHYDGAARLAAGPLQKAATWSTVAVRISALRAASPLDGSFGLLDQQFALWSNRICWGRGPATPPGNCAPGRKFGGALDSLGSPKHRPSFTSSTLRRALSTRAGARAASVVMSMNAPSSDLRCQQGKRERGRTRPH